MPGVAAMHFLRKRLKQEAREKWDYFSEDLISVPSSLLEDFKFHWNCGIVWML